MNTQLYEELSKFKPYDEEEKNSLNIMLDYAKKDEDILTRDNDEAHVTVSAWILNKDRAKVLMIYHNIYDSWAWIGGHADGDGDLKRVVLKEIEEETGVKNVSFLSDGIYGINVLPVERHLKRGKYVEEHLHLDVAYVLEANESEALRKKDDENSGVKWIPIDKLREYVTEEKMLPVYERLCEKIKNIKF